MQGKDQNMQTTPPKHITSRGHLARWLAMTSLAACGVFGSAMTAAQPAPYPDRAIRFMVPWPAGGATDVLSRLIAQKLGERLKQTVIVENKGGAGGNIGTTSFVKEKPDGYSILMATSSTNAANPYLYANLGFDPVKDFTPIAYVAAIPNILEVSKNSRFNTAVELINEARQKPGTLNFGSGGVGASQHLAGSLLKSVAEINIIHVPYKGSGPAIVDLLSGQLDLVLDTGSLAQVKSGNLKALAVASENRLPALPEVPTFAELGYPKMLASAWYGIMAPAGLPQPLTEFLNQEINAVLADPAVRNRMEEMGAIVSTGHTPAWFAEFVQTELIRYNSIVKNSGAKME
jgi:tripartite-type tricarboxylate transporter receptor subunit TctC